MNNSLLLIILAILLVGMFSFYMVQTTGRTSSETMSDALHKPVLEQLIMTQKN